MQAIGTYQQVYTVLKKPRYVCVGGEGRGGEGMCVGGGGERG